MIITNRYAQDMNSRRSTPIALGLTALAALVMAGCAPAGSPGATGSGAADDAVHVVASTNVYGSIVEAIGGDRVDVTALIDSTSQDPHAYEASARDQLTISRADLIVANGGGYDSFVDGLVEATGTEAEVLRAVEFSHDYPDAEHAHVGDDSEHGDEGDGHEGDEHEGDGHADEGHAADDHDRADDHGHDHIEGFNEHVWYDPHTVAHLAEDIVHHLAELDPEGAAVYETNGEAFAAGIADLETGLAGIADAHEGEHVFGTEPVPVYLTAAAGLVDVAPAAFTEAVEEGQDVSPATLLEARRIIESGEVRVVIANAQTGGAETNEVIDWSEVRGIPVLEFTELVPEGETYLTWMTANVDALAGALAG